MEAIYIVGGYRLAHSYTPARNMVTGAEEEKLLLLTHLVTKVSELFKLNFQYESHG